MFSPLFGGCGDGKDFRVFGNGKERPIDEAMEANCRIRAQSDSTKPAGAFSVRALLTE